MATFKRPERHGSAERRRQIRFFLSYSHVDGSVYTERLANILQDHGIDLFFERTAPPTGDRISDGIRDRLQRADVLIFVGTPAAMQSNWVQFELEFFHRRGRRILPIVFGDLFGSMPYFLRDIQWLREELEALQSGPSRESRSKILRAIDYVAAYAEPTFEFPPITGEKRPLNEGKLILVGRGEVGKTSLVRRLTSLEFRGDESKTQGINITRWQLECKSDTVRLNIWDFGGQEIMHATHQFFLTERTIYLLVLNGREGGEDVDAEYWLKHIETFGGSESPVIVVQNKIRQHPFNLNYRGLQSRYPQIRGFIKTDCSEGLGIEELRDLISQVADQVPEIRMLFPVEWFNVKEDLESTEHSYMGYAEFRERCSKAGVEVDSDRDTLSFVLHCLGIALNYRDDPRLRETSVLKPEWVTQGIYKILNAKTLAERQGELHLKDLAQLLPKGQYPPEKHLFMLELMRKFSLCFAFPDEPDRYLVPELLGKEESQQVSQFPPTECLNFEYHYGVLPEGLMPRFIVRSHTLSRGQDRWRSGVILAHEGSRALVMAQPADRRIVIRVIGGDAGARRRLLAIVRYDLDRINAEFKDRLEVQARVPLTAFPSFSVDYKKLLAFEKQEVKIFPEFVGQEVVSVNVNELLNGIDFDSQRNEPTQVLVNPKAVFFSYSHKDEALRDELETHLKLLQRQGIISAWHDRKIPAGAEWDSEIDRHLELARIILLLVSADFISSDYCWGKEVERALARHHSGEATVIAVMLRKCDWRKAPFSKLQGLPRDMKPVTAWRDRDAAWTDVAGGIRKTAESLK